MNEKIVKNVGATERIVSVALGAYLLAKGLRRLNYRSVPTLMFSGYLFMRGGLGYCPISKRLGKKDVQTPAINIKAVMTVAKPREFLYNYWRRLSNLPAFMHHLQEVKELNERQSHWVAEVPGIGGKIEWDAEIVKDEPNERIGWQSINGALIRNAGKVEFFDAPRQETEVRIIFSYHPPAGGIGTAAARLFHPIVKGIIENEAYNFKRVIEAGEIPTINGQPSGKRTGKFKLI
ncbi:SRPBCC family protein [Parapedobacter sp. GCM10030251]|uniref:SRPBCC family protein n=1 Tax=Parapedobacter sp. GCM10030251 TaxID=3273419 RepID=UPI00360638BE